MRIRRIGIQSILTYDAFNLDFGAGGPALHILHGPNEVGKSTLLRLLVELLYGGTLEEGVRDGYDSHSRISGCLEHPTQPPVEIVRKRNRTKLVMDVSAGVSEEELTRYLGGYDKERFRLLFGFDHQKLRVGGESLLQSGGHAGISLFEAGGGVQYLQRLASSLAEQSSNLLDAGFMARSAKQLNKALRAYQDAERAVRTGSLRGEEWHRERDEIERLDRSIDALQAALTVKERDASRLERMKRIRVSMGELLTLRQRLKDLSGAVVLPEALDKEIPQVLDLRQRLHERLLEDKDQCTRYVNQLQAMVRDEAVLALAQEISVQSDGLQQYESRQAEELPTAQALWKQRQLDAVQWLKTFAPGVELDEAETLRIPFVDQERLARLADDLRQARAEWTTIQERYDEALLEQGQVREQLAPLTDLPDIAPLRRLVQEIRGYGDLEGAITERDRELERKQVELNQVLETQTVWTTTLDAVRHAPMPLHETIDQYVDTFTSLQQQRRDCDRQGEQLQDRLAAVQRDLAELERFGAIPVEDDLHRVRAERDAGWQRVKHAWLGFAEDGVEEDVSAGDASLPPLPLHESFERAVRVADETADWMRKEADRSAKRTLLLDEQTQIHADIEGTQSKHQQVAAELDALSACWLEVWEPSGICPKSPPEMKDFMVSVYRPLMDGIRNLQALEAEQTGWKQKRDVFRAALSVELRATGGPRADGEGESTEAADSTDSTALTALTDSTEAESGESQWKLRALLRKAEQIIDEVSRQEAVRTGLEDRQRRLVDTVASLTQSLAKAQGHVASLEGDWQVLQEAYPTLPQGIDIAASYTRQLANLFTCLEDMDRLNATVAHLQASCKAYENQAERVSMQLAEPLNGASVAVWVRRVRDRLRTAQSTADQMTHVEAELAHAEQQMALTDQKLGAVDGDIAAYCKAYGCTEAAELRAVVEQSVAHKAAEASLEGQERVIREAGDGLSLAQLEAEFAALTHHEDADGLPGQLASLSSEIAELQLELDGLKDERRRKRVHFESLDGSQSTAADSAQEAETHLAEVDRLWNEYLRIELARRLLQRAIESFREQNQSSILLQASDFFQQLTTGRYQSLAVEYDGDTPFLEARHADGARRRVQQMSDGARDQLFLALRLAFVAQHLESSDPLPLIMDDILVHFDDARTKATLQVLHALSERTQILYFTHHQSVVDAARELPNADRVRVHGMARD